MRLLCDALAVSRAGFYAWRGRRPGKRAREDQRLKERILEAHKRSHGRYGSPRVHQALKRAGETAGRHRIARLMRQEGIWGKPRKPFVMD